MQAIILYPMVCCLKVTYRIKAGMKAAWREDRCKRWYMQLGRKCFLARRSSSVSWLISETELRRSRQVRRLD